MSTTNNQLTIEDSPIECVEEILKRIVKVADRNSARLVCKLWRDLLNYQSSFERYLISPSMKNIIMKYRLPNPQPHQVPVPRKSPRMRVSEKINFYDLIPLFLSFQRKRISIYFRGVDLRNSIQFWTQKGAEVAHLQMGFDCVNFPLIEIIEYCPHLRSLTFDHANFGCISECIQKLREKRITDKSNVINLSVDKLIFNRVRMNELADIVHIFITAFPRTKNIYTHILGPDDDDFHWLAYVNSLRDRFKDLQSVIKLSSECETGKNTFVFDSRSGNIPLKVMSLSVGGELDNDHFPMHHFSQFPCQGKYLEELYVYSPLPSQQSINLNRLEKIVSRWPLLILLSIRMSPVEVIPLTNQLSKNNIKFLEMLDWEHNCGFVNHFFLHSFVHLKSILCEKLVYSDFAKLVTYLECLEELIIEEGAVEVNEKLDRDLEGITTVLNRKLNKLQIPMLFLHQSLAMNFIFNNLIQLILTKASKRQDEELLVFKDMDHYLKRIDCPHIEILDIHGHSFNNILSRKKRVPMIMNILSHYPTLYSFSTPFYIEINDQIKQRIRQTYPRLQKINGDEL